MRSILILICLSQFVLAQVSIKGKVFDKTTNEAIPFVSIGIKGKTIGTVSDENGNFELQLKSAVDSDSLKISAIGYQSKSYSMLKAKEFNNEKLYLSQASVQLGEVTVKPTKTITKVLGNKNYNTNIQCAFQGVDKNYKGVEAAIRANNKKGRLIWLEKLNFFIIKNELEDSATFRLNLYKEDKEGLPGENILRKPIVFRSKIKNGIVEVNLKKYNINTDNDFFISLECLSEQMDKDKLTFSGSVMGPAYFKMATFADWEKSPIMGLDFNVTVSYQK
jgi:hypothetical protein